MLMRTRDGSAFSAAAFCAFSARREDLRRRADSVEPAEEMEEEEAEFFIAEYKKLGGEDVGNPGTPRNGSFFTGLPTLPTSCPLASMEKSNG